MTRLKNPRPSAKSSATFATFVTPITMAAIMAISNQAVIANDNEASSDRRYQASLSTLASQTAAQAISQSITSRALGLTGFGRIRLGDANGYKGTKGSIAASSDSGGGLLGDWTVWATPVYSEVENKIQPLTSEGSVKVLILGLEASSDDQSLTTGVAVSKDWIDINTTYNNGTVKGDGLTVSPYLAYQLDPDWLLDASLGVGSSSIESRALGITSRPDTERAFLSLGLTYTQVMSKWFVMGKAALSTNEDKVKAFTSSDGQSIGATTTRLHQAKFGVHAIYDIRPLTPYIAVYQVFNDFSVSGATGTKPREYSSTPQAQLGVTTSKGPFYAALAFQVEKDRNQWRVYGGFRF